MLNRFIFAQALSCASGWNGQKATYLPKGNDQNNWKFLQNEIAKKMNTPDIKYHCIVIDCIVYVINTE